MRVLLPEEPKSVKITDAKGKELSDASSTWDAGSRTCLLKFENSPEGIHVAYTW